MTGKAKEDPGLAAGEGSIGTGGECGAEGQCAEPKGQTASDQGPCKMRAFPTPTLTLSWEHATQPPPPQKNNSILTQKSAEDSDMTPLHRDLQCNKDEVNPLFSVPRRMRRQVRKGKRNI